jgi:serine O-acetyltransferase
MSFLEDMRHKKEIFERDAGREIGLARILMSDGTSANLLYRCMRWSARRRLRLPAYAFQYLNKVLNHCVIGVGADFGPGFVILHPTGVVINSKVQGGERVAIESDVVMGDEKGRSPVLGDDIFVGAGARIVGPVNVGSEAKVGANAVVVKDVPPNATVVGIPARPLERSK